MFGNRKQDFELLVRVAMKKSTDQIDRAQRQFIEEQRERARQILQVIEKHLSEQGALKAELVLLRARIECLEAIGDRDGAAIAQLGVSTSKFTLE